MAKFNIVCSDMKDRGWGLFTQLTLPGGGKLGVYQPRHKRPKSMIDITATKTNSANTAKKVSGVKARAKSKKK